MPKKLVKKVSDLKEARTEAMSWLGKMSCMESALEHGELSPETKEKLKDRLRWLLRGLTVLSEEERKILLWIADGCTAYTRQSGNRQILTNESAKTKKIGTNLRHILDYWFSLYYNGNNHGIMGKLLKMEKSTNRRKHPPRILSGAKPPVRPSARAPAKPPVKRDSPKGSHLHKTQKKISSYQ